MRESFDLSLYLVTDSTLTRGRALEDIVAQAAAGGVTIVQLREKELPTGDFIALARRLKSILAPYNIPLIINDRVDVALAIDAEGVHIGQSDISYEDARALLGPDKIIGLSVENHDEVLLANALDVDYIGISPLHATPTKTDTATPFGIDGCTRAVNASHHPSVAIGGINISNIAQTMGCGVDGVAVVSAIISADDPQKASAELRQAIDANRTSWSERARRASEEIYNKILTQPFNTEMMSGTLAPERFKCYIEQDIIYIANYAEEMQQLAMMLPNERYRSLFEQFAKEGMEAEKSLHALLTAKLGGVAPATPSPITELYIAHTRQYIDSAQVEMSMAAVLPCIWIYSLVGKYLYENGTLEGNPYRDWIETYSSDMMEQGVALSIEIADTLAASASQTLQMKMKLAFVEAVEFEYLFWEWGYCGCV